MVYRKPPKSRKYKKSQSISKKQEIIPDIPDISDIPDKEYQIKEDAATSREPVSSKEKKAPPAFSFLTSLLGSGDRAEKSGKPIFSLIGHDIYFDDLLLIGLILLLITDKVEDEILLIILAYLLIDFI
jgi:hypothetical protein